MKNKNTLAALCIVLFVFAPAMSWAAPPLKRVCATPEEAAERPDFKIQGEYTGTVTPPDGSEGTVGLQVATYFKDGDGKYRVLVYIGGLPGDGWNEEGPIEGRGKTKENGVVHLWIPDDDSAGYAEVSGGNATIFSAEGQKLGVLRRTERKSPTLGKKPPKGAIVLFDGTTAKNFKQNKMTKDGLLIPRADTVAPHGSGRLHVEFRTPYQPYAGTQGRGNSGVYLQSRYEVQVLDSFGVFELQSGDCGGIYSIQKPPFSMCYPPLAWQTYDIDFTASKKGPDGKIVYGRMTVRHNGVLLHENVELDHATTACPVNNTNPNPEPLHIQDHGNPVRFRNIWFVPAK